MTTLREAAQQALEAWDGGYAAWFDKCYEVMDALRAALAQQEQEPDEQAVEDAIEAAYWHFDARKKGLNEWASAPQSERDAFKAEARKLAKGYFPTRGQESQQTKREMLAVADAFIRGRKAALAQQEQEPISPGGFVEAQRMCAAAECHTVYTHPPRREPLSDEWIAKALAGAGLRPEDYREDGQIEPLVRAIKRTHGIGSKE